MAGSERPKDTLDWRPIIAGILLASGIGLFAVSFVWPRIAVARSNWSADQARKYQAASAKLHSLSHEYAQQSRQGLDQEMRDKLEAAKTEYESLRGQLDAARDRPKNVAFGLFVLGVIFMIAGALGLYRSLSDSTKTGA